MTELATVGREQFVASDIEMQRRGDTVTADTLELLSHADPSSELVLILGSDTAAGLSTWRRPEVVRELATIAVVDRPGDMGGRPPRGYTYEVVPCPLMDISSTDIRRRARSGLPIDYLVPDPVAQYIHDNELYTEAPPG